LIPNACSISSNVRTKRNNIEAHNEQVAIIFSMDKFETLQERKNDGTSKEEESHVVTSIRNKGKGKKNVTFSLKFHLLQKIILGVSKCIVHILVHL
jgi:hypothetical protein